MSSTKPVMKRVAKEVATGVEMETIEKVLQVPAATLNAMEELAQITGRGKQVDALLQDALQVYEWLIEQESQNKRTVAVPDDQLDAVKEVAKGSNAHARLIAPNGLDRARAYFEKRQRKTF